MRFGLPLFVLLLTACGAEPPPAAAPAPVVAPAPMVPEAKRDAAVMPDRFLAAWEFAGPDTFLAPMPTAVVLLRNDPTVRDRNIALCEGFKKAHTEGRASGRPAEGTNIIPVRWPRRDPQPFEAVRDCTRLTDTAHYDYKRADAYLRGIKTSATERVAGPGPFIVILFPTDDRIRVTVIEVTDTMAASALSEHFEDVVHKAVVEIEAARKAEERRQTIMKYWNFAKILGELIPGVGPAIKIFDGTIDLIEIIREA